MNDNMDGTNKTRRFSIAELQKLVLLQQPKLTNLKISGAKYL